MYNILFIINEFSAKNTLYIFINLTKKYIDLI